MSATTGPNPAPSPSPIELTRNRIRDIRNQWGGSILLAAGFLVGGLWMIAENWDEIGAAAVFGLGCVFLDGAWVMIVCIGALSGHRASAEADLLVAERVTRHEYGVDARLSAIEEEQAATIRMLAEISRTVAQLARAYGLDADDLERRRSGRRNSGD